MLLHIYFCIYSKYSIHISHPCPQMATTRPWTGWSTHALRRSPLVSGYICIYVCVYIYIYMCMYVCVCVCIYLYIHMCVCMYAYLFVCIDLSNCSPLLLHMFSEYSLYIIFVCSVPHRWQRPGLGLAGRRMP